MKRTAESLRCEPAEPLGDPNRRRFIVGAVLSTPVALGAAAAASAGQPTDGNATLQARLARLEDETAIRALQRLCMHHVNAGTSESSAALGALFADGAVPDALHAVRRLDPAGTDDDATVEVAVDGAGASTRCACAATIEVPIEPSCPLVEMARAQGGGFVTRTERGVLESAYVKRAGVWKIARIEFRAEPPHAA